MKRTSTVLYREKADADLRTDGRPSSLFSFLSLTSSVLSSVLNPGTSYRRP